MNSTDFSYLRSVKKFDPSVIKGANRMTDKTAIEKAKEALEANLDALCSLDKNQFGDVVIDGIQHHPVMVELVGRTREALAALEAEKPADSADAVACRIEEIQLLLNDGSIMAKRHAQMVQEIQSFAESYHAERCKACRKDRKQLPEAPRV